MAGICTFHTHLHTQLKKSEISHTHTHTHTESMRGFPVKTGTGSGNTHGDGFICHLYRQRKKNISRLFKRKKLDDNFSFSFCFVKSRYKSRNISGRKKFEKYK